MNILVVSKKFFSPKYILVNKHVYYRKNCKLIFNNNKFRLHLIKLIHDMILANHSNAAKYYKIFIHNYFWIDMSQDVRKYIYNCYVCIKIKYFQNYYNEKLKSLLMPKRWWIDIFINFIITLLFSQNLSRFSKKNSKLLTRVYSTRFLQHMKVMFFFK